MNYYKKLIALALFSFYLNSIAATNFHQLESTIPIKSDTPDWDYLAFDPVRSYLFIGARNEGAIVVDIKTKKVIASIEDSIGANAIALVPEFDKGYTTNTDGTATIFQLSTLKNLGKIKLGNDADAGFYEPVSKQIVFMRGESKEMTFVNPKNGEILARLSTNSKKLEGTAPDGKGHIFTALRDRNSVIKVDVISHKVVDEWSTTGCDEANGLALDTERNRIFVGCRGKNPVLLVMNALNGEVISTHVIGRGNDGVIYDPDKRKIYASGGVDANLVIYDQIDANNYKLAEATTTRPYARTIAIDPTTKKIYTVTAEGTVDPSKNINTGPAAFYPNYYFPGTLTVLIYAPK